MASIRCHFSTHIHTKFLKKNTHLSPDSKNMFPSTFYYTDCLHQLLISVKTYSPSVEFSHLVEFYTMKGYSDTGSTERVLSYVRLQRSIFFHKPETRIRFGASIGRKCAFVPLSRPKLLLFVLIVSCKKYNELQNLYHVRHIYFAQSIQR